jgi:hypothetical protein
MRERSWRIGACSWSLRASADELAFQLRQIGVGCLQIALDPLREDPLVERKLCAELERGGLEIRSGMVAMAGEDYSTPASIRASGGVIPDRHWKANAAAARLNAALARRLGLPLVTFHAGYLPAEPGLQRSKILGRVAELAEVFAAEGVALGLETGQESAATLAGFLEDLDHPEVGVNFDPANMLLYDSGEPLEALELLVPFVRQVHLKDALRPRSRGSWGEEVPLGQGQVDWTGFFRILASRGVACDLMIEREAGNDRVGDMRSAREFAERMLHRAEPP